MKNTCLILLKLHMPQKSVNVHMFSKKLKDVTERTNIRQFCRGHRFESFVVYIINTCNAIY